MEKQEKKNLLDVEFVITQDAILRSVADPARRVTEEEIHVLGANPIKAKVFLEKVVDPLKVLQGTNQEIPQSLMDELKKGTSVKFVGLGCGFLDSPDCRVTWARLGLKLRVIPAQGGSTKIIHVFPRRVTEPVTIKRQRSIETTIGLEVAQIFKPGVSLGVGHSEESIVYHPTVASYVNNEEAYWTFESPVDSWITGDLDVFFIAKFPEFGRLQAQFVLGLEVKSKWGNIWPFRIKDTNAIESFYNLDSFA